MKCFQIILVSLLSMIGVESSNDFPLALDETALNALPLEALLNIRNNILNLYNSSDDGAASDMALVRESGPEALPFSVKHPIKKKGSYYVHYVDEDDKYDKKKTITKFFQLSVISLAFMAFGGYLIFLIIAAIKSKYPNNIYDPNTTQIMQAMINMELNKRKKKRRKKPIKVNHKFGYKEDEESFEKRDRVRVQRSMKNNGIDNEKMYFALVNLCEGYSQQYQ